MFQLALCLFGLSLLGRGNAYDTTIKKHGLTCHDLSYLFEPNTPYLQALQNMVLNYSSKSFPPPPPNNHRILTSLFISAHYSTHMDAPSNFAGPDTVSDIPLEKLYFVKGYRIDVTHKIFGKNGKPNRTYVISTEDIRDYERKYGNIRHKGLVLFHTGWPRFWPDFLKFLGGTSVATDSSPGLSAEASEYLAGKEPYGVGIDTAFIDVIPNVKWPSHNTFSRKNIYILENLRGLDLLPPKWFYVHIGIQRFKNGTGFPCRPIACVLNRQVRKWNRIQD